ncbi:MAG TPA: hypothetical protein VEI50_08500 [Nitrospiraceae bacterium]|nr:hypothetical protein [Nitrospiraceae bacterium]
MFTQRLFLCCVLILALTVLLYTAGEAATVTELDITGGSISLNFGSLGTVSGTFTQNGQLLMGQYQPPPNIFPPITISHLTFSIFTSSGQPTFNFPPPSGTTSGATITVDLSSLFTGLSSTKWGWMSGPTWWSLNIGGIAAGSFNQTTDAFNISWTHAFTGIPHLTSGSFTLQGMAQVAAVPLPGAAILFLTGLIGMGRVLERKRNESKA